MSNPSDVVGHKTFFTPERGYYHEPMTRAEADALIEHCEREKAKREALMPDEETAIRMLCDAVHRLQDFGWRDPVYCPKDGSEFLALEAGSSGKHACIYMGEWPDGKWSIVSDGDMSPSRPVLFKSNEAAKAGSEK